MDLKNCPSTMRKGRSSLMVDWSCLKLMNFFKDTSEMEKEVQKFCQRMSRPRHDTTQR